MWYALIIQACLSMLFLFGIRWGSKLCMDCGQNQQWHVVISSLSNYFLVWLLIRTSVCLRLRSLEFCYPQGNREFFWDKKRLQYTVPVYLCAKFHPYMWTLWTNYFYMHLFLEWNPHIRNRATWANKWRFTYTWFLFSLRILQSWALYWLLS